MKIHTGKRTCCHECNKKLCAAYYASHRAAMIAQNAKYRVENKGKCDEMYRSYRERNRETRAAKEREYRRLKPEAYRKYVVNRLANDPLFRLKIRLGTRIRQVLKTAGIKKRATSKNILGVTDYAVARDWISSQFNDGMSWENHGKWHIDHVIPLCLGKTESEMIALCHYTNLQPLWAIDNIRKSRKFDKATLYNAAISKNAVADWVKAKISGHP